MSKKLFLMGLISVLAIAFIIVSCGRDQKNPVAPIQTTAKIQVDGTDPLAPLSGTTLSAVKSATGELTRTWNWTIAKSVTPASWDLFKGDEGTSEYTVTVTKTGYTDVVSVSGTITVTNGGAVATVGLTIYDDVLYKTGGGPFQVLKTVQVSTEAKPVLAPGETYSYPYEVEFAAVAGAQYKNSARVTITNHSGHLGEPWGPSPDDGFDVPTTPTSELYGCINVTDTYGGPWGPVCETTTFPNYSKTFTTTGTYNNTATITELPTQSASATVTVKVWDLEVTKDATTSYDRYWDWTIDKSADQSELTLSVGQQFLVNYTVVFTRTFTDDNKAVNGNIKVHNPAPMAATINSLTDVVSPDVAANVTCSVTFPYSLVAGKDLNCTYSAELPDLTSRTNTATATLQNYSYDKDKVATASGTTDFSGTHAVVFGDPTNEYDECVTVSDTYEGSSVTGTICASQTFTYSRWIGPYNVCGDGEVENTADFETNDQGITGSDSWTISVSVPCAGGCTLTFGYWKTHSSHGPAPEDPTWGGMEDELFFSSGKTYYEVLRTPPASNVYYNLAHQYIAAYLNKEKGANFSAAKSAFDAATALFNTNTPADAAKLKGSAKATWTNLATVLDNYNNGLIGPGHCDE
jgi:hypothetical protein